MDATPSNTIDVAAALRIVGCPTCGVSFALPASLYLTRTAESGAIFCPSAGHKIELRPTDPIELAALNIMLLSRLATAQHNENQARLLVARVLKGSALETDAREIKRRCNVLAERAETVEYGRRICPLCGKAKMLPNLTRHLLQTHKEKVQEMPPEAF